MFYFTWRLCVGIYVELQKSEIIEQPMEQPKGIKIGKGNLPVEEETRDGAKLKPVIVEPEVSIYTKKNFYIYL